MRSLVLITVLAASTGCAMRSFHEERVEVVAMQMFSDACTHPNDVARRWLTFEEATTMTRLHPSRDEHAYEIASLSVSLCDDQRKAPAYGREIVSAQATPDKDDPRLAPGVTAALVRYVVENKVDGTRTTPGHAFPFVRTAAGWRIASSGDILAERAALGLPEGVKCLDAGSACEALTICCVGTCGSGSTCP